MVLRASVPRASRALSVFFPIVLCLFALCLFAAPAVTAAEGKGLELRPVAPEEAIPPGGEGVLRLELVDAEGRSRSAGRDIPVDLRTEDGLLARTSFVLEAGATKLEVPLRPERPGAWVVEVVGRGLFPTHALVLCAEPEEAAVAAGGGERAGTVGGAPSARVEPPVLGDVPEREIALRETEATEEMALDDERIARADRVEATARPRIDPELRPPRATADVARPAFPPAPVPEVGEEGADEEGGTADEEGTDEEGGTPDEGTPDEGTPDEGTPDEEGGTVQLKPDFLEIPRGPDGLFRTQLHAIWTEEGAPAARPSDLELAFLVDPPGGGRGVEPARLRLPAGELVVSADLRSEIAGDVELTALYDRGESTATFRFLAAQAAALGFPRDELRLATLAGADVDLTVQLLDAEGRLVVAEQDRELTLRLDGPVAIAPRKVTVPRGDYEVSETVRIHRFGSYELTAAAPGLTPANARLRIGLDWLLLSMALLGGLLGSAIRILYQRKKIRWHWGLVRLLVLGAAAALLVLLLAVFRLLSLLEQALAAAPLLGELPLASPLAVLLLGLLAGLGLDAVLGRFLGGRPQPA